MCSDFTTENLSLKQRLSALEAEAKVSEVYKKELELIEQQHQNNAKHMDFMEKELETNRQELLQNREQMQLFKDKDLEFDKLLEYWNELNKINFRYVPIKDD